MIENMDLSFFGGVFKRQFVKIVFVATLVAIGVGLYSKIFIVPTYSSSVTFYFGRVNESSKNSSATTNQEDGSISKTTAQLSLANNVRGDYNNLVTSIAANVQDRLKQDNLWQGGKYKAYSYLLDESRMMILKIHSSDPFYCQDIINIYADEFIKKAEELINVKNIEIIEESRLQLKPIAPNTFNNIILGFIGGFLLSFIVACLGKVFDRTFINSEQLERVFHVPVIGTVRKDYKMLPNQPLLWNSGDDKIKSHSKIIDDFRVFRVNLINRGETQNGVVLALTSAFPKEGKTFCTTNLGAALAEAGYKVLLIDCDTEKKGLQRYFGNPDDKGLINVLSDESKFEDVVQRNLNNSKMDVLFCGNKDVVSSNLIISPDFKKLVKDVKEQYDFAFLDVSTNQGVADIVSAGSTADSMLLLVQAGKTKRDMIQNTVDILKRANLDISGVILNGIDEE